MADGAGRLYTEDIIMAQEAAVWHCWRSAI